MNEPTATSASAPASKLRISLRWLMLLALVIVGCGSDQATKNWAGKSLPGAPMTLLPKVLEFRYAENRAIAFSMFHSLPDKVRTPLIFTLTSVALAALLSMIWGMRKADFLRLTPLALIMAGAVGNVQDRFMRGYVVDFVHVHWRDTWSFPIFNVADSLITVGGGLFLVLWLFHPEAKTEAEA